MNRIATAALILSFSLVGQVASAGAIPSNPVVTIASSSVQDTWVLRVKGTSKSKSSAAPQSTPAPKPKPAAPRPSLYSGPDYDNVLGLGNYMMGN